MKLDQIKDIKDLRKIKFSELFYFVFDSDASDNIVNSLLLDLSPEFINDKLKNYTDAFTYQYIKEQIIEKYNTFQNDDCILDDTKWTIKLLNWDRNNKKEFEENYPAPDGYLNFVLKDVCNEELTVILLEDILSENYLWVRSICSDKEYFNNIIKLLDEIIDSLIIRLEPKVLNGLYYISTLNNDEDVIIYFGDKFHCSFANIDAYTGLMYINEYFVNNISVAKLSFQEYFNTSKNFWLSYIRNEYNYHVGQKAMKEKDYKKAIHFLAKCNNYKDTEVMQKKCKKKLQDINGKDK